MNYLTTKAKLFVIRCGISQETLMQNITWIVIIINAILAAKKIFDTFYYSYQLYSITISNDLRKFFSKNSSNTITFWDYSSDNK